jgi:hypothetical protein
MGDTVAFLSREYFLYLALLLTGRGLDILSTWIATPHLLLEGNPIAKLLGWRWGIILNLGFCLPFALVPLPALMITTMSVLVAAHNFDGAWLMRSMGEKNYRAWISRQHVHSSFPVYLLCLLSKTALWAAVGVALLSFGNGTLVPTGIGFGILGYAMVVLVYSSISVWRLRRFTRKRAVSAGESRGEVRDAASAVPAQSRSLE